MSNGHSKNISSMSALCVAVLLLLGTAQIGCVRNVDGSGAGKITKGGDPTMRIGVLLPLSGRYALFGRSSLHGIECAAGVKQPCGDGPYASLVIRDTGGSTKRAVEQIRELAQVEKVSAIIGPLLSEEAIDAAREAEAYKVPLISLSQRDGVADVGEHIYQVGVNPKSQVKTIARYSVNKMGHSTFAVLYPNNSYGKLYMDLFRNEVSRLGGKVIKVQSYDPRLDQIVDIRKETQGEDQRLRSTAKLLKNGEVVEVSNELPKIDKIRGVDAVFIPDSYRALLAMFSAYGPDIFGSAQLLGVNRWNSAGIVSGGSKVQGSAFVDGFFKGSASVETQQFVQVFSQTYHVEPTILEAQAYDATRFILNNIRRGTREASGMQRALQSVRNMHGVTGSMKFTPNGDVEKDLFLLTVKNGRINEIDTSSKRIKGAELVPSSPRNLSAKTKSISTPDSKYDVGGDAASSY